MSMDRRSKKSEPSIEKPSLPHNATYDGGSHHVATTARRSLLPKKTVFSNSRSTTLLQTATRQMRSVREKSSQPMLDPPSNLSTRQERMIPGNLTVKDSLPSSAVQSLPSTMSKRSDPTGNAGVGSHLPPPSRINPTQIVTTASEPQSSAPATVITATPPIKKDSSLTSSAVSLGSEASKASSKKFTAAQSTLRRGFQNFQPRGEALGHHRTSSHQLVQPAISEGTLPRPKNASFRPLSSTSHRPPPSTRQPDSNSRKSSKQLKASVKTQPSSISSKSDLSPDQILRLRMELMQLSVLHRLALETHRQWEQSAEQALQRQRDALHQEHLRVQGLLEAQSVMRNQAALLAWSSKLTDTELTTKIQFLSRNITQNWQLIQPEGDHTRLVQKFEIWVERARIIKDSRQASSSSPTEPLQSQSQGQTHDEKIEFIESMDDRWVLEVGAMQQYLATSLSELKDVGEFPLDTSSGQVLHFFKRLTASLAEGLGLIQALHAKILAYEKSWIDGQIHDIIQTQTSPTSPCRAYSGLVDQTETETETETQGAGAGARGIWELMS